MDENNEEKNENKNEVQQETVNTETKNVEETKGFGIAAMVLGIVGIICVCIPYLSLPCAILAIIFAIVGMKKPGKGMGIAGLVLGILTVVIYVVVVIAGVNFLSFMRSGGAENMIMDTENLLNYLNSLQ